MQCTRPATQRVENFCSLTDYLAPESHLHVLSLDLGSDLMSVVDGPPSGRIDAACPRVYPLSFALSLMPHPDWSPRSRPELRASGLFVSGFLLPSRGHWQWATLQKWLGPSWYHVMYDSIDSHRLLQTLKTRSEKCHPLKRSLFKTNTISHLKRGRQWECIIEGPRFESWDQGIIRLKSLCDFKASHPTYMSSVSPDGVNPCPTQPHEVIVTIK